MKEVGMICVLVVTLLHGFSSVQAGELSDRDEQRIKAEISDLVSDYAVYRDEKNAEGYANTFAPNGRIWLRGEWFEGRDAIRKRIEIANPNVVTMHVVTTGQIKFTGRDTATGIQYVTVYTKMLDDPPDDNEVIPVDGFVVLGKYYDKYVRTDDGWKFAERQLVPVFTSDQ